MPSCMSKHRFVRVRISILKSKVMPGTWRPLEADPGGQPGTDREVTFRYAFMYVVNIGLLWSEFQFLSQK